jgi:CDGSH-type Zn-finger protein
LNDEADFKFLFCTLVVGDRLIVAKEIDDRVIEMIAYLDIGSSISSGYNKCRNTEISSRNAEDGFRWIGLETDLEAAVKLCRCGSSKLHKPCDEHASIARVVIDVDVASQNVLRHILGCTKEY